MGFWSNVKNKIQEAIRRVRKPKLPEAKANWFNQEGGLNKMVNVNNDIITALNQYGYAYPREDGSVNKIMVARILEKGEDGTLLGIGRHVAFEMPANYDATNMDLLNVVDQWYQQSKDYNQDKECIFLGNMYGNNFPEFMQNMQAWVDQNIGSQIKSFEEMENQKRTQAQEESKRLIEERQKFDNMYRNEAVARKIEQDAQIRNERINNPKIEFRSSYKASDGKSYMDYDGINISNGDILRLRKIDKIGKDTQGNYLYSGYVNSTFDKNDVEVLNHDGTPKGVPVCFTLPGKLEDFVANNNYNDINKILALFSQEEKLRNNNGQMNFIGSLDRNGNISKGVQTQEMYDSIMNLQNEARGKMVRQQGQDGQEWTQ